MSNRPAALMFGLVAVAAGVAFVVYRRPVTQFLNGRASPSTRQVYDFSFLCFAVGMTCLGAWLFWAGVRG